MKHILKLILITLLLCVALAPSIYAETKNTALISVQVTSPSAIISPSAITLVRFDETNRVYGAAFATGTVQEKITDYISSFVNDFVGYDMYDMDYWLSADNWSFAHMDVNVPGLYNALSVPELGDEYVLMEGVSLPEMRFAVSIQTPGKPSLDNCFAYSYSLWFPWVLSEDQVAQPEAFTVWLQQDSGAWTLLTLNDEYWIQTHYLMVAQYVFEEGSSYALKVVCPDGETSIATFLYKGDLTVVDDYNGDRDGGDVLGGGSGVGNQPAPTLPQAPDNSNKDDFQSSDNNSSYTDNSSKEQLSVLNESQDEQDTSVFYEIESSSYELGNHIASQQEDKAKTVLNPVPDSIDTQLKIVYEQQQPAIVSESYSPTQTVISGLRLKDLCADEESIVFGSGNLTVSIPSNLLLSLNLSNLDTLTVQLTQPKTNQILLAVEVSGKSVKELPGAVLRVKYMMESENAEITVQNETGEYITNANFDGELLNFNADTTGTYTILEMANTPKVQKGVSPLIFVLGGLILIGGGITYFWRRHHG